jgi:type I thyroxine 5'-deiodinase
MANRAGAAIDVQDPKSIEERRAVADRCETTLGYGYPTYVDDVDDEVSKAYAAKPTRLYFLDADGRVIYNGGLGPWGFKPRDLERAIEQHLVVG